MNERRRIMRTNGRATALASGSIGSARPAGSGVRATSWRNDRYSNNKWNSTELLSPPLGQQWTAPPIISIGDDTRNHKFGSVRSGRRLATTNDDEPQQTSCNKKMTPSTSCRRRNWWPATNESAPACRQEEAPLPLFSPPPLVSERQEATDRARVQEQQEQIIVNQSYSLPSGSSDSTVLVSHSLASEPKATDQDEEEVEVEVEVERVASRKKQMARRRTRKQTTENEMFTCRCCHAAVEANRRCNDVISRNFDQLNENTQRKCIKSASNQSVAQQVVPTGCLDQRSCQSSEISEARTSRSVTKCGRAASSEGLAASAAKEQRRKCLVDAVCCRFVWLSEGKLSVEHPWLKLKNVMVQIVELVFIYSLITSLVVIVPASSTNYWPSIKASLTPGRQLTSSSSSGGRHQATGGQTSPAKGGPLLIGQHYNNFSSIIPYSIVQDSDYGNPSPEDQANDQTVDEELQHQYEQVQARPPHLEQKNLIQQQQQQQQVEMTRSDSNPIEQGDTSKQAKSRALLQSLASQLDSNRLMLPQMQQIKSRFNQGCVGGTKCQFFAFCWMSGGSLGASCGLLMTCCVTPSRQEIQPGFYGPVVNDPYCGRSTSKINRIVGGTDASFGQFPWQAFVQVGGSRCGGALISSRHVVTAGHCVARSQHTPSSIKVTLGDYILNSDIESIPHEVFSVVEVLLHPNFRFTPQADRYDVAVLELDRTASYKDNIKPICLPQKDAAFVGRVAYVAGWGALQAGSKLRPKVLQHVAVPVIENQVCESWHRRKGIDIRIYDEMMCAGYELGQRDACQGDSGGPLMLNQFGVWYLVGIVSAGYSCAKQYQPGIYHRVSSSSDWISSNIYQQGANN